MTLFPARLSRFSARPCLFGTLVTLAALGASAQAPEKRVVVEGEKVNINGNVVFGGGSADIDMDSFDLLDEIAGVLRENPRFSRVRIEGHTDSSGDDLANMTLSQERAEAVTRYLIRQGIERKRLSPVGFGEEKPVATNRSGAGRAKNRRVDVVVLEVDGQSITSEVPLAKVTVARNRVDARQPAQEAWKEAAVGLGLHRAWRVQSRERSAAEITFRDNSLVQMRENTLVVIFGAVSKKAARRTTTTAMLEHGTLRNRLGSLSGDKIALTTPSSEIEFSGGSSVISVDRKGKSTVANHEGKSAAVFGRKGGRRGKKSVKVKVGYGTRIEKDKDPERPRKLPPAPKWAVAGPVKFLTLEGGSASVAGGFSAVDVADAYVVELLSGPADAPQLLSSVNVPAAVTRFEFHGLPPGKYRARVAALDEDGLESVPSEALALEVEQLSLPGGGKGAFIPPPSENGRAQQPRLLPGTEFLAPAGMLCQEGNGPFGEKLHVVGPAQASIRCKSAEGKSYQPFDVQVTEPKLALAAEGAPSGPVAPGTDFTLPVEWTSTIDIPVEALSAQVPAGIGTTAIVMQRAFDGSSGRFGVPIQIPKKYRGPLDVTLQYHGVTLGQISVPVANDMAPPTIGPPALVAGAAGLVVKVALTDNVGVTDALVYFRDAGRVKYAAAALSPTGGTAAPAADGMMEAAIPGVPRALEYYIEATDAAGNGPARSGSEDAPLRFNPEDPPAPTVATAPGVSDDAGLGFSRWWGAVPLAVAGVAVVGMVVFVGSVIYGIFRMQETQNRFDAGDLSAATNDDFQDQARLSVIADGAVAAALFIVAGGTAAAGGALFYLGE